MYSWEINQACSSTCSILSTCKFVENYVDQRVVACLHREDPQAQSVVQTYAVCNKRSSCGIWADRTCIGVRLRLLDAALSGGLQAKYALSIAFVCLLSRLRALRSRIITASKFSMRTRDSGRTGPGGAHDHV